MQELTTGLFFFMGMNKNSPGKKKVSKVSFFSGNKQVNDVESYNQLLDGIAIYVAKTFPQMPRAGRLWREIFRDSLMVTKPLYKAGNFLVVRNHGKP